MALCLQLTGTATAQQAPAEPVTATPILTLDQERLFRESDFGRAALQRAEDDTAALSAENRRIEAGLEAEERDLTERRPTLSPEDFSPLAQAFDIKVEEIRQAQDAKSRAITRRLEEDRQVFFEAAVPMLGQLLADTGAVAILSNDAIILSLKALDVTDQAVLRMNAALPPEPDQTPVPMPQVAPVDAPAETPAPAPTP